MHAVETANLNVETLKVMKSASNAMKVIHGGMSVDKVDETMYVPYFPYHIRGSRDRHSGWRDTRAVRAWDLGRQTTFQIKQARVRFFFSPSRLLITSSCMI